MANETYFSRTSTPLIKDLWSMPLFLALTGTLIYFLSVWISRFIQRTFSTCVFRAVFGDWPLRQGALWGDFLWKSDDVPFMLFVICHLWVDKAIVMIWRPVPYLATGVRREALNPTGPFLLAHHMLHSLFSIKCAMSILKRGKFIILVLLYQRPY